MARANSGGGGGQFGDTTYTKVFVGGLAWETQKEGMRSYFEQFGEILEAVVITDKNSGRSKGYGFVTFREPEAAMQACFNPYPVIDGRRANCNLAYLGVQRSKTAPLPLQPYVSGGRNIRVMKSIHTVQGGGGGGTAAFATTASAAAASFPHYAFQQGIPPYNVYGYSPYSSDYNYPLNYQSFYQAYGGLGAQYQVYGGGATAGLTAGATGIYPYLQYGAAGATAGYSQGQGYSMQYPQMYQYAAVAATAAGSAVTLSDQQYTGPTAFTPTSTAQAGMTMTSLTAPTLPITPTAHHYSRLIPTSHFTASAATQQEQSLA